MVENRQGCNLGLKTELLDSQGLRKVDKESQELGFTPQTLMESAGLSIWKQINRYITEENTNYTLLVIAGPGNNGADGFVTARYAAAAGWNVFICPLVSGDTTYGLYSQQFDLLKNWKIGIVSYPGKQFSDTISNSTIILDCVFGTGQHLPLSPDIESPMVLLSQMKQKSESRSPIYISLDIPTGFLFPADITFSIGGYNRDLLEPEIRSSVGTIHTLPIAFPPRLLSKHSLGWVVQSREILQSLPPGNKFGYKKNRGGVFCFGGSSRFKGAPFLSLKAAARCGAGYLYVSHMGFPSGPGINEVESDPGIIWTSPEIPSYSPLIDNSIQTIICGPGIDIESSEDRKRFYDFSRFIFNILEEGKNIPTIVFDAGALPLLSNKESFLALNQQKEIHKNNFEPKIILTPHIGELRSLLKILNEHFETPKKSESVLHQAEALADFLGVWIVVKYSITALFGPKIVDFKPLYWDEPNPVLGFAGSGDLLSGIIGGICTRFSEIPLSISLPWSISMHNEVGRLTKDLEGFCTSDNYLSILGKTALNCNDSMV